VQSKAEKPGSIGIAMTDEDADSAFEDRRTTNFE
jgi:hypothetical protein